MEPFATVEQLEAFWKTLTEAETTRAEALLELASNRLRMMGEVIDIDLDEKKADSATYGSVLQWVVMEATKRAMLTPTDLPPVDSLQQTAGPYSENIKYSNPSGDLWFKRSELADLGLYGKQSLTTLSTSRTDIYRS